MEYLGFWVTDKGVRPTEKEFKSIVNMAPRKNKKEVRIFIGLIIYYR